MWKADKRRGEEYNGKMTRKSEATMLLWGRASGGNLV
jgi:hypothetical protein